MDSWIWPWLGTWHGLFSSSSCLNVRGLAEDQHVVGTPQTSWRKLKSYCVWSIVGWVWREGIHLAPRPWPGHFPSFLLRTREKARLICLRGLWALCCLGGLWNWLSRSTNKATSWRHAGDDNDYYMRFRMARASQGVAITVLYRRTNPNANTRIKEKGD